MLKIKLNDFNNLSKSFNFCIYNICYAKTVKNCCKYISYINEKYSSYFLIKILKQLCYIIGANIINISYNNYEPQGASVTILVSEDKIYCLDQKKNDKNYNMSSNFILTHLDKSHVCAHTYPEFNLKNGICSFRIDIELSTCGLISPLKAINYLIDNFEPSIITIDYKIRGFTRDTLGNKHFIDHKFNSIQDFISNNIKKKYFSLDVNILKENIFHTKMKLKEINLVNYLFNVTSNNFFEDKNENKKIYDLLNKEIHEIFLGHNI